MRDAAMPMSTTEKPDAPIEPLEEIFDKPVQKDGSTTFTVVLMLTAVLCCLITAAIAFHDMYSPP